ncbi:MAG: class I SAM-dependent methyltransferase [Chloroflexi bacterium]|nr:class I SAM-dependent methyltransferase [Chloroflexota bacterium]MCI0579035.1 class I SAM-dependent methyltransferase [Chloroflexota bacterium]MCI0646962.1 class I SAM-dependent methyltransferase [Chloroflexota bacterium]MCI0729279.1 class I SAM-dependent methyltransferase [Chloroflexota bacterium]
MLEFYSALEQKTPKWLKWLVPQRLRIWLGYQIKGKRKPSFDLGFLDYALTLPAGETEASLFDYLASFAIEGEHPAEEFQNYLRLDFKRFLYTLQMIPDGEGRLLEIGAEPYFTSMLLRKFTRYELAFTNFFGADHPRQAHRTLTNPYQERLRFDYHNVNVEKEPLPFPDGYFDVVLLCEVLEHFTHDPLQALANIQRVLKPGGCLILTTPNVTRLDNVIHILIGVNIYDPYSGYGPYGRHNREYSRHEVYLLLTHLGFQTELSFTSNVRAVDPQQYLEVMRYGLEPSDNHQQPGHNRPSPTAETAETRFKKLFDLIQHRPGDLGHYIFTRARKNGDPAVRKPRWLYRSYSPDELCD